MIARSISSARRPALRRRCPHHASPAVWRASGPRKRIEETSIGGQKLFARALLPSQPFGGRDRQADDPRALGSGRAARFARGRPSQEGRTSLNWAATFRHGPRLCGIPRQHHQLAPLRRRFFLVASELRVLQCVETAFLVPTLASPRRPPESRPAKKLRSHNPRWGGRARRGVPACHDRAR
jgi:hypothetical protein